MLRGVYAVSETGVVGRGLYLTFGLSRWLLAKRLAVVVLLRVGLTVVSFSWYIFITPKVPVVPCNINKKRKIIIHSGETSDSPV